MMRFNVMNDDMQSALTQFCMEQELMTDYMEEGEVESLVESAFAVMNRIPCTGMKKTAMYRYHFYAGDELTDEIFPENVRDNGLLVSAAVHLGTITVADYCSDENPSRMVSRGYDVVYDLETEQIRLFYSIATSDDEIVTVYRVEVDSYDSFDLQEFMIELSAQMIAKLKRNQGCFSE